MIISTKMYSLAFRKPSHRLGNFTDVSKRKDVSPLDLATSFVCLLKRHKKRGHAEPLTNRRNALVSKFFETFTYQNFTKLNLFAGGDDENCMFWIFATGGK